MKNTLLEIENKFKNLSLEYKIFNINKAKAFPGFLEKVNCFYTNKIVSNSEVKSFYDDEIKKIAILSHRRWLIEKYQMGWRYGNPKDEKDKYRYILHDELIEKYEFNSYDDVYGDNQQNFNYHVKLNYIKLVNDKSINYRNRELKHINLIIPLLKLYEGVGIYCLKKRGKDNYINEIEDSLLN